MTPRDLRFFIDFDGTVTTTDVVDLALENFADGAWRAIEKDWVSGRIGSRECLERQIAILSTTQEKLGGLLSSVRLDPGFVGFLEKARDLAVPVAIVSDGFRWMIERIFEKHSNGTAALSKGVPIHANDLRWKGGGPQAVFSAEPCEHGCANCKAAVIRRFRSAGEKVVFVGDGLSDRYAAAEADIVFAKGKLAAFCFQCRLSYRPYATFYEIGNWLSQLGMAQAGDGGRGANRMIAAGGRGGMLPLAAPQNDGARTGAPAFARGESVASADSPRDESASGGEGQDPRRGRTRRPTGPAARQDPRASGRKGIR